LVTCFFRFSTKMHFNIFIIFAVCLHQGLSLPTKTGFAPVEWVPVHTYDRGEDLSVLFDDVGSGDIDHADHGSGDPDDDDGSGDVVPVPVRGFSQMRVIQYSADDQKTIPFFEAAVTEILSEYLKNSEDSTEQVTVKVNSIRHAGDDIIVDFSAEVRDDLWTRAQTDAILYDKQKQFEGIFGNTMIMIPHVSKPSSDKLNKMVLSGVSKLADAEKLREIIAEALNVAQKSLFSLKVPYHADNVIITHVSTDDDKLTVEYFVAFANGEVTPAADVHKAVQGQESKIAEAMGANDVSIIEPSGPASEFPTWMIAAIVVGGLVGVAFIAVVTSILVKKHNRVSLRAGYEDLDKQNMSQTQDNSGRY